MVVMLVRPFVVLIAATTLLMGACTWFGDDGDPSPVPSPTNVALPSTPDELPPVDVATLDAMLAGVRGTPVVVNVWASWCEPCEREIPMLVTAAGDHPDVRFVGVNSLDSREGAESYISEHGITYPNVFDPEGAILTDRDAIGPPVTVFYDADGTEVASIVGEIDQETLDEQLAAISS